MLVWLINTQSIANAQNTPHQDTPLQITLFAASSLSGSLEDFFANQLPKLDAKIVYGSSSKLVRQIERGAPAEFVILAHPLWSEKLNDLDLFEIGKEWLTTNLVLVGQKDAAEEGIAGLRQAQRLVTGHVDHVPLGIYARQVLQANGIYNEIAKKLILAPSAGHAARLLQSGAVDLAILYKAQAVNLPNHQILHEFDPTNHDQVRYHLFVRSNQSQQTQMLLAQFYSLKAKTYFEDLGFQFLTQQQAK